MNINSRTKEKILQDFHSKYVVNENNCWEWIFYIHKSGYARFRGVEGSRKYILAHRFSYEIFKGKIPKGLHVCHNCPGKDNRCCVNPDHLWIGTSLENNRDKKIKGTQCRGETNGIHKLNNFDIEKIKIRICNGEFCTNIAKDFNVSAGLIYHIKNGNAWKHLITEQEIKDMKKNKTHFSVKLTDKDIIEIRKRYKNGDRVTDLAKDFNVQTTMISRIKNGKCWKHLLDLQD